MVSSWNHHLEHWQQQLTKNLPAVDPIHAGVGTVLVLALVHAMRAFFSRSDNKNNGQMNITVKWGREKIQIPLPSSDEKLASLRQTLADHTSLSPSSFKLVHAGAVMKDDNALISAYGIHSGSTIALIGGGETPVPPSRMNATKKPNTPSTEESSIEAIQEELASVNKNIVPALDAFLVTISPEANSTSSTESAVPTATSEASAPVSLPTFTTTPIEDVDMEHRRLGELLLQSLLRLDVINLDGAWTDARKERKGAVKIVQGLLDKLDGGWRARIDRLKLQS